MTRQRPLGLGTHIFVSDADAAVAFYSEAFGAAELIRHCLPDGRVLFVELAVGPDKLLLSEEIKELNAVARPR
jgi:PhnB protein